MGQGLGGRRADARPKLSALGVVYEALGFAITHFWTALRVAWLPILLIMVLEAVAVQLGLARPMQSLAAALRLEPGYTFKLVEASLVMAWPLTAVAAFGVILQASMAVPLIRYAGLGEVPHHRAMHLGFGVSHVNYVVACAASFAAVIFAAKAVLIAGLQFMNAAVIPALAEERMVFADGSLHSVSMEPVHGDMNAVIARVNDFFAAIGIDIGAIEATVLVPVVMVAGYVLVRLMPLPFFAATKSLRGLPSSIAQTWRLTGGWNIFPMLAIVLVAVLVHMISLGLFWVGLVIFGYAAAGSEALIAAFENFVPGSDYGSFVRGLFAVLSVIMAMAATAFMTALNAGIGGALVHRGGTN